MSDNPQQLARIEDKLDRTAAGQVMVSSAVGGVQFQTMLEVMEFSKLMSLSGVAVPPHLRGSPGTCLAICVQALEWKMSPFAVANKSYVVTNKGVDRISYESQLLHAIIESRAPIVGRLEVRYEGEGDDMICIVSGTFRGDDSPREWKSPTLGKRRPGLNEHGQIKGSPLWKSKPSLQMFYDTSRDWCRVYCPDVLLGLYTPDEIEEIPVDPATAKDVSPNLMARLPGKIEGAGFAADVVDRGLADEVKTEVAAKKKRTRKNSLPVHGAPATDTTPSDASPGSSTGSDVSAASPADQVASEQTDTVSEGDQSPKPPETADEYVAYAERWIEGSTNPDDAEARYDGERDLRDTLQVAVSARNKLGKTLKAKVAELSAIAAQFARNL